LLLELISFFLFFNFRYLKDTEYDNKKFVSALISWTFHERGVLRLVGTSHHRKGETQAPQAYIIKDEVV